MITLHGGRSEDLLLIQSLGNHDLSHTWIQGQDGATQDAELARRHGARGQRMGITIILCRRKKSRRRQGRVEALGDTDLDNIKASGSES